jgi:hypothetical protein
MQLALSAWLTSKFNFLDNERSLSERYLIYFALFTSTWTVCFSGLMLILFCHSPDGSVLTSVLAHLILCVGCTLFNLFTYSRIRSLGFTWIMWIVNAAAVTNMLSGGLNCAEDGRYFAYCNQLNALEGFAWLEWFLVTLAIIVVLVPAITAARRGGGFRGGFV